MDSSEVEGFEFTANLITPDNDEKYLIELSNGTLTNAQGFQAKDPDLSITINRTDLEPVMMGLKTLRSQIDEGVATAEGDISILGKLADALVTFDPRFEILPGTAGPASTVELSDYEVGDIGERGE
jgi:alkyl sulfatase BDS1-like metallo-beta-lactamase superfamily hydrolase